MEDRTRSRVYVMPAMDACPRLPLLRSLIAAKTALRFALRAVGVFPIFGVTIAPEPFKASGVVGKLSHELHKGILRVRRLSANRGFAVPWCHDVIVLQCTYTVKG